MRSLDTLALDTWTNRPIECGRMSNHLSWQLVDSVAADLGAKPEASAKWRQPDRGVPAAWQIKIMGELMARGVPVSINDFRRLPPNPGRIATHVSGEAA